MIGLSATKSRCYILGYAEEAKNIASFIRGFQKRVTISNRDFTFSQYIKWGQQFEQINRQKQYITFTYMVFVR